MKLCVASLMLAAAFVFLFSVTAQAACPLNTKNYACCRMSPFQQTWNRIGGGCGYTRAGAVASCFPLVIESESVRTEWRRDNCDHLNPPQSSVVLNGTYKITSTFGCPDDPSCNHELSWKNDDPHPIVVLDADDPVVWRITRAN